MQPVGLQAEVPVPLLHQLRAEFAEKTTNKPVCPVLRTCMKDWASGTASSTSENPVENFHKTSGTLAALFEGDVDMVILENDASKLAVDVTGCRYADFLGQLGEPELGAILTCEPDDHVAGLSAPTVPLSRSTTIMNGAAGRPFRCRFEQRDTGA